MHVQYLWLLFSTSTAYCVLPNVAYLFLYAMAESSLYLNRSRGLVKVWQDDSQNLLLHQFSPYNFLLEDKLHTEKTGD